MARGGEQRVGRTLTDIAASGATGARVLVVNPVASGVHERLVESVCRELGAHGAVDVVRTERKGHARELAAALAPTVEVLFVLGGDGVYNEVVDGLRRNVAVGFLPGGATSVLPRALGLPRSASACARRIAPALERRRIGLGRVNGRRFTFACGVGLDAELVRAIDRRGRDSGRRAGDVMFAWELVRLLVRSRAHLDPALTIDGVGRCAFAIVANCDPYTYAGRVPIRVAPEASFSCGLDLVAPRVLRPPDVGRLAWDVVVRPTGRERGSIARLHDVDRLRIACDLPMPLQVDGEDMGDVDDIEIVAERDALTVLV